MSAWTSDAQLVGSSSAPEENRRLAARRGVKLPQFVASEIAKEVVSRGLTSGDRLPSELVMVKELGVGRASLREGLRILESYGLISIKQGAGGGPIVNAIHPADLARTLLFYFHGTGVTVRDIAQARQVVEPAAARLAAERQDEQQMAHLRELMDRVAVEPTDDQEYYDFGNEFHYAVSGLSGNPVLDLLGRALRILYTDKIFGGGLLPPEAREGSGEVHRQIGEAILSRNGILAEELMRKHLRDMSDLQEANTPEAMDQRVIWDG